MTWPPASIRYRSAPSRADGHRLPLLEAGPPPWTAAPAGARRAPPSGDDSSRRCQRSRSTREQVLPAKAIEQHEHLAGRQSVVAAHGDAIHVQRACLRHLLLSRYAATREQGERHHAPRRCASTRVHECRAARRSHLCAPEALVGWRGYRASPQLLEDAGAAIAYRARAHRDHEVAGSCEAGHGRRARRRASGTR